MVSSKVSALSNNRSFLFILIFAVYFTAHALIRWMLGWYLTEDEAAILNDAQTFAWIYDGQMPLYAWSQSALFNLLGPTLLSLTVLKNTIMLLICLTVFTMVERVSNVAYAVAATLSLLFVPQLAWTSQHTLTTPVLGTLFAATTFLAFSKLREQPSIMRYISLGAMIGLGAISSVAYLLVPAALIPAALATSGYRSVFFKKGIFLTLLVAGLIAYKPYQVLYASGGLQIPDLDGLFPFGRDIFMARATSAYDALQTILTFSSLLIVGSAIAVYGGLGRNQPLQDGARSLRELMLRTVSIGIILLLGLAFVEGSSWINAALIQPLVFLAAPALALYLFPAMSVDTHRKSVRFAAGIALVVLLVTPAHYSFNAEGRALSEQVASRVLP